MNPEESYCKPSIDPLASDLFGEMLESSSNKVSEDSV